MKICGIKIDISTSVVPERFEDVNLTLFRLNVYYAHYDEYTWRTKVVTYATHPVHAWQKFFHHGTGVDDWSEGNEKFVLYHQLNETLSKIQVIVYSKYDQESASERKRRGLSSGKGWDAVMMTDEIKELFNLHPQCQALVDRFGMTLKPTRTPGFFRVHVSKTREPEQIDD